MRLGVMQPPVPNVANRDRGGTATTKSLGDQRRPAFATTICDGGNDAGAGLHFMHGVEHEKGGHRLKARFFSRLIFTESRPRLQPAFGREIQAYWSGGPRFVGTIQVYGQHIADGSPLIFALLE